MDSNIRDYLKNLENGLVYSRSSKPLDNNTVIPPKISQADGIALDFRYDQSSIALKF